MGNFIGDIGSKIKNTILPSTPDVTKQPSYTGENDFATGLGQQRSNFTPTTAPSVVEGTKPADTEQVDPITRGLRASGWKGAAKPADPNAQTQYADPTGLNNQNFALGLDRAAAEGTAPSAAENLYRKGTDEGMASQLALAATTQGDNPGMSQRAGLAGAAKVGADATAGGAALRANEMATARDEYGNLSSTTRGQTLQSAEANQAANLQQQLANNQFYLGLTDEQQKALQALLQAQTSNNETQQKGSAATQQFVGGLLSGGGQGAAGAGGGGGIPPAAAAA